MMIPFGEERVFFGRYCSLICIFGLKFSCIRKIWYCFHGICLGSRYSSLEGFLDGLKKGHFFVDF